MIKRCGTVLRCQFCQNIKTETGIALWKVNQFPFHLAILMKWVVDLLQQVLEITLLLNQQ